MPRPGEGNIAFPIRGRFPPSDDARDRMTSHLPHFLSRKRSSLSPRASGLDDGERRYLGGERGRSDSPPGFPPPPSASLAALQQVLRVSDGVALGLYSPLFDLLDCNAAHAAMFPPPCGEAPQHRNTLWRLFVDEAYRSAWADWESIARRLVDDFRHMSAGLQGTVEYRQLIASLADAPDFERIWHGSRARQPAGLDTRFRLCLPDGRRVCVEPTVMQAVPAPGLYLAALAVVG